MDITFVLPTDAAPVTEATTYVGSLERRDEYTQPGIVDFVRLSHSAYMSRLAPLLYINESPCVTIRESPGADGIRIEAPAGVPDIEERIDRYLCAYGHEPPGTLGEVASRVLDGCTYTMS